MHTHPDIHMTDTERHAYNTDAQKDAHTQLTPTGHGHAFTLSSPALKGQCFLPLSPGQGLQLPLAGPGHVLASLRQSQRSLPAAQPQPSPDHTLCVLLCPPQRELPRAPGRCGRGGQCLLNKWSWFPSLSPVPLPCTLLSPKQDPRSPASHQFSLIP